MLRTATLSIVLAVALGAATFGTTGAQAATGFHGGIGFKGGLANSNTSRTPPTRPPVGKSQTRYYGSHVIIHPHIPPLCYGHGVHCGGW
jgi:hypothetical protein